MRVDSVAVTTPLRVVITGLSTRAAAESAARAGFQVTAIDAFGDLDQHPDVCGLAVTRDLGARSSAQGMARASRSVECDAVAYLASFENHPRAVATLASGRALWGNAPDVLRRVRDPLALARALSRRGFSVPATRVGDASAANAPNAPNVPNVPNAFLLKPLKSGGGQRVRRWDARRTARVPRGGYLQEWIDGTPGSIAFVAAKGRVVPLGMSRQLAGDAAFGATGYRYCGNILGPAEDAQFVGDSRLVAAACALATAVAEEFGLVGVNGIDFIARAGVPYAIEVNPRWSASMELVERAYGIPVFAAHAAACVSGALPAFGLVGARRGVAAVGRAVIFARRDLTVGDTRPWLEDATVRDVPHPGEHIRAGAPICTVFATAVDAAACYAGLVRRAEKIYGEVGDDVRAARRS